MCSRSSVSVLVSVCVCVCLIHSAHNCSTWKKRKCVCVCNASVSTSVSSGKRRKSAKKPISPISREKKRAAFGEKVSSFAIQIQLHVRVCSLNPPMNWQINLNSLRRKTESMHWANGRLSRPFLFLTLTCLLLLLLLLLFVSPISDTEFGDFCQGMHPGEVSGLDPNSVDIC